MIKQFSLALKKVSGIIIVLPVFLSIYGYFSCTGSSQSSAENDTITYLDKSFENIFRIGVALSDYTMDDSTYMELAKKHFNSITAENAMKWEFIHPEHGRYDFKSADRFVTFGEENGMHIVGHVLIWHKQTPGWVFQDETGNRVSRDTLLLRMRNHIHTVVGRYKGRVQCWDVINEAVGDDGLIRKNIWYEIIGIDYVQKAFEYAHEADPEAVLIYNDYSLLTPVKRAGVVKLIGDIKARGVNVDAIGMQAHYHLDYPDLSDLEQSIIAYSGLGCKVMITEMDINALPHPWDSKGADIAMNYQYDESADPYPHALPDSMQTLLADRYADFFTIFIRHHKVIDRVTLWGIYDGSSWLNNWPIKGRSNYPLLFDRSYRSKPAFWAVVNTARKPVPDGSDGKDVSE